MGFEVVVGARGDAFELVPAPGEAVLDVEAAVRVVSELVGVVLAVPGAVLTVRRVPETLILFVVAFAGAFLPFITGLPANATGVAVNSEREIFVAMGTIGRIDVYNPDGNLCGTYVDVSALGVRPNHMEINLKDDLLFTAPSHANGNGGDTYIALPNGGSRKIRSNAMS